MFSLFRKKKPAGAVRNRTRQGRGRRTGIDTRSAGRWAGVFTMAGLLVAAAWYIDSIMPETVLPLAQVGIDGEMKYLRSDRLEAVIKANIDGGYFTVDLDSIRTAVLELPWVQEVTVRRQWPGGLHLEIEEKQAIAYWGEAALLSSRGDVFQPETLPPDLALPALLGPEGSHQQVWGFANSLTPRLQAMGLTMSALALDPRRAWTLELDNGVVVKFGRETASVRIDRFEQVFMMPAAPLMAQIGQIDMRYPNGFAVMFRNDKTNESADDGASTRVNEVKA